MTVRPSDFSYFDVCEMLTSLVANNGLEALELIREADRRHRRGGTAQRRKVYSAVLMDLEMPIMDGLTAVRELRTAEAAGTLARTIVIALTGNARQGQIDQALAAGMDTGKSLTSGHSGRAPTLTISRHQTL